MGHAWAYLPDVAEAAVRLIEQERTLEAFEVFNFGGHWLDEGVEMARAIARAAGRSEVPVRGLPWPLLKLASPFVPFLREILEMRYLWQVPLRLDNSKLVAQIGTEPHTPLDDAVHETLEALGCMRGSAAKSVRSLVAEF